MNEALGNPDVLIPILGLVFLVFAGGIGGFFYLKKRAPKLVTGKASKDKADSFARKGKWLEAARMYEQLGLWEPAAIAYVNAEGFVRGAEMFLKAGKREAAAGMYERAGKFVEGADILQEMRKYEQAAKLYVRAKAWKKAADALMTAGEVSKAAMVLEKAGDFAKAAEVAEKGKDYTRAIEYRRKAFAADKSRAHMERVAELYRLLNRPKESLLTYLEIGNSAKAAAVATDRKMALVAVEWLKKQGREHEAAAFYEKLGDPALAAEVQARKLEREGDPIAAAEVFARAGQHVRAAEIYSALGHEAEAAHLFSQAGDNGMAAKMYERMNELSQAGQLYEKGQMWDDAARVWKSAGNKERLVSVYMNLGKKFEAGQAALAMGDHEGGVQLLNAIEKSDPRYGQAQLLLANFYRENRDATRALKAYSEGLSSVKLTQKTFEAYYWYARLLERSEGIPQALDIYKRIAREDPTYKDVEQRLKEIESKIEKEAKGSTDSMWAQAGAAPVAPPRFSILNELGRGGMGVVYRAQDTKLDRIVAYKMLPDEMAQNEAAVKNFLREARSSASLTHPNIVVVYDAGQEGGHYYIVMEYIEGKDLRSIIRQEGPLPLPTLLDYARQTCAGLAYAHQKRIVHRDIKPSNLMLAIDKKVKIMDFGLAKVVQEVVNYQTAVGGTPYYMAPEQVVGGEIDHRTDQYAFGVSLFELATGAVPFPRGDIGYHHVNTPPPDARQMRPDLPDSIWEIIQRMLAKKPDDRFKSTEELQKALESVKL